MKSRPYCNSDLCKYPLRKVTVETTLIIFTIWHIHLLKCLRTYAKLNLKSTRTIQTSCMKIVVPLFVPQHTTTHMSTCAVYHIAQVSQLFNFADKCQCFRITFNHFLNHEVKITDAQEISMHLAENALRQMRFACEQIIENTLRIDVVY